MNFQPFTAEELVTRLAAIVDSSEDAIFGTNCAGTIDTWNAAAEQLFGYREGEILGQSILLLIPPDKHAEHADNMRRLESGTRVEHNETQRLRKDGQKIEVSLAVSPVKNSSGKVIGAAMIARDVGDRHREDVVRSRLAAIVESSDDAIVAKDLNGIITDWNAAAERLFGYRADEIVGRSVLTIIPPELQHEEPGIISRLRRGERIDHYETRRMRKDGQIIEVSLTVSPIRDSKGNVIGGSKILRDIRDRRAAEAALLEKEKFVAAGRLAATLAHEVNNPLESITNLAYLLSKHSSLDAEGRNYADLLLKEVQRAGEITRQTLGYYRQSKLASEVDLEQLVEHVFKGKHKKLAQKNINFEISFVDVPPVQGFSGELRQVFDNLIENAIDAVPFEGKVAVRGQKDGVMVSVAVQDNGLGIPPEALPKIFEPFFTTKIDKGSGLGLWVTRSIVEKHGGKVQVESKHEPAQHGTVFTVELPILAPVKEEAVVSPGQVKMKAESVSRV